MASRSVYLPIIAAVVGFASAFATLQLHSMLFCLLPLWAFLFGYFSSWKTGFLSGFLLFVSYTTATTLMRWPVSQFEPLEYLFNFLAGGFVLCIVGWGAPSVRRRIKSFRSVGVLVVTVLLLGWCLFISFPRYTLTYWATISSSERLDNVEVYLPVPAVAGEPYADIFDHPGPPGMFPDDWSLEIAQTEHGRMLKLGVSALEPTGPVPGPYSASIFFRMSRAPQERLQFMPRYDVQEVEFVRTERHLGPVRVEASDVLQEFRVPIKLVSDAGGEARILLGSLSGRSAMINFLNHRGESYQETLDVRTASDGDWVLVAGEAVRSLGVSGVD